MFKNSIVHKVHDTNMLVCKRKLNSSPNVSFILLETKHENWAWKLMFSSHSFSAISTDNSSFIMDAWRDKTFCRNEQNFPIFQQKHQCHQWDKKIFIVDIHFRAIKQHHYSSSLESCKWKVITVWKFIYFSYL